MQIWPHSATLDEAGAAPAAPAPSAGGTGGMGAPGGAPGMAAMGAGEILLNRAESAALAALETEENEAEGLKRAQAESGLTREQVDKLKARAATAIKKGITLKGVGFTKKPTPVEPDEPGLTRDKVKKPGDAKAGGTPTAKAKEANSATASVHRRVTGPDPYTYPGDDYGFPVSNSESAPETGESQETNALSTLAGVVQRARKRRLQRG